MVFCYFHFLVIVLLMERNGYQFEMVKTMRNPMEYEYMTSFKRIFFLNFKIHYFECF